MSLKLDKADYVGLGFVSNDHLAVLPFIPMDTKVKMLSHAILGGGPAGNATAGYVAVGARGANGEAPRAAFLGTVGDDADGRMILDEFAREGVATDFIKVRKGATSAIAYLWIEEKTGNRSCAWTREGLDELTAAEIEDNPQIVELIQNAKVLHLDGHNAAGAIAAAKIARAANVTVMYDAGTHRDGMMELLALADLLICSEEFILKLTGLNDAEAAVREVFAKYRPKVCGATMGARGSVCFDGETMVKCPAFPVEKIVDTTGCGDLFHTGFAVRYVELTQGGAAPRPGAEILRECQRFGAAVSALKCRGISGRPPACPTREEVDAFISRSDAETRRKNDFQVTQSKESK